MNNRFLIALTLLTVIVAPVSAAELPTPVKAPPGWNVTREGGDDLDVRNVAGITTTLEKKEIVERGKREKSIMPEGLTDKLTTSELASLLAFLETLKSK